MNFREAAFIAIAVTVGLASASAQTSLFAFTGDAAGDRFGSAAAIVGDVDADGAADFAVGAPNNDANATNAGMVKVFSGRTHQVIRTWLGLGAQDNFGSSIAPAGDLDADGHADVLIGAPGKGYALVVSGLTGTTIYTCTVGPIGNWFGWAVAGGAFVDLDAVPDFIIGAPRENGYLGALRVYSGATGALIRTHTGTTLAFGNGESMGFSAAFMGDLNGDGADEYVSGGPGYALETTGIVRLFDGLTGAQNWSLVGASFWGDEFGWAVARIGDLTGDGRPDVLASARQDGCFINCQGAGYVRVLDSSNGAIVRHIAGQNYIGGLGYSLAAIGDLDRDGFEDFAVSEPAADTVNGGVSHPVRVISGATGNVITLLPESGPDDSWGFALAAGDASDDGLTDLLVGAPRDDDNGTDSGTLTLFTIVRSVTTYCVAKVNSLGCTPSIFAVGTPSATQLVAFRIKATNVINNKSGLLFYGFAPNNVSFQGGTLCIRPPVRRTSVLNSGGNPPPADCSGLYSFDFNAYIRSGQDPALVAGEELYTEYWSRDPAAPSATGLTDAVAFLILP